jgi:hypothetical protein
LAAAFWCRKARFPYELECQGEVRDLLLVCDPRLPHAGAALAAADRVGFVLGCGDGYGHDVFATGPARLTVTDFRVE